MLSSLFSLFGYFPHHRTILGVSWKGDDNDCVISSQFCKSCLGFCVIEPHFYHDRGCNVDDGPR